MIARSWYRLQLALDHRRYSAFGALRAAWYRQFWQQAAAGSGATLDDLGDGFLRLVRGGRHTIVRGPHVRLDDHLALEIAGHRRLVFQLLADRGHPVPPHVVFDPRDCREPLRLIDEHGAVVVKPGAGTGGGRGVTTGVNDHRSLRRAAAAAAASGSKPMAEAQVPGASYRLLFLGGELVDAVRRDPPVLQGDGRRTIARLMRDENRRRLATQAPVALNPLRADLDCRLWLRQHGRHLRSIPAAGEEVHPKRVVNENTAAQNHVVTGQVHPATIAIGVDIARDLRLELMGLDVICHDISRPLGAHGVINEINTTPGLHHHLLVAERSRPLLLGERLIEFVLGR